MLLIVFNLQAIIEAKTGSGVGADQDLTLLTLAQLRKRQLRQRTWRSAAG
jgi:hypothetical protein